MSDSNLFICPMCYTELVFRRDKQCLVHTNITVLCRYRVPAREVARSLLVNFTNAARSIFITLYSICDKCPGITRISTKAYIAVKSTNGSVLLTNIEGKVLCGITFVDLNIQGVNYYHDDISNDDTQGYKFRLNCSDVIAELSSSRNKVSFNNLLPCPCSFKYVPSNIEKPFPVEKKSKLELAGILGYYHRINQWDSSIIRLKLMYKDAPRYKIFYSWFEKHHRYIEQNEKWRTAWDQFLALGECIRCNCKIKAHFNMPYCKCCLYLVYTGRCKLILTKYLDLNLLERMQGYFEFARSRILSRGNLTCRDCGKATVSLSMKRVCFPCVEKLHDKLYPQGTYFSSASDDLETILKTYPQPVLC